VSAEITFWKLEVGLLKLFTAIVRKALVSGSAKHLCEREGMHSFFHSVFGFVSYGQSLAELGVFFLDLDSEGRPWHNSASEAADAAAGNIF
jgi:hypothetical protein